MRFFIVGSFFLRLQSWLKKCYIHFFISIFLKATYFILPTFFFLWAYYSWNKLLKTASMSMNFQQNKPHVIWCDGECLSLVITACSAPFFPLLGRLAPQSSTEFFFFPIRAESGVTRCLLCVLGSCDSHGFQEEARLRRVLQSARMRQQLWALRCSVGIYIYAWLKHVRETIPKKLETTPQRASELRLHISEALSNKLRAF